MERKTKGLFLKNLVQLVKKRKGPEGLNALKEKLGDIEFSAFKDYPMETQVRLNKAASEILYGADKPEAQLEFGKLVFKSYAESIIGKTMLSLLGNDLKKMAFEAQKAFKTVNSGLEIEVKDLGPRKIGFRMKNNPYHIKHYEGILAASAEYFGHKPKIESRALGPEDYEYIVEWS